MWQLRMRYNLRPSDVASVVVDCFAKFYTAYAPNCYFAPSGHYFDIAIIFRHSDFLKECNNLAIRRRFHAVTLTFDP